MEWFSEVVGRARFIRLKFMTGILKYPRKYSDFFCVCSKTPFLLPKICAQKQRLGKNPLRIWAVFYAKI